MDEETHEENLFVCFFILIHSQKGQSCVCPSNPRSFLQASGRVSMSDAIPYQYGSMCHAVHEFAQLLSSQADMGFGLLAARDSLFPF